MNQFDRIVNQRNLDPIISVMLGLAIPIIIFNLLFVHLDSSPCLNHQVQKAHLDMTLKTWLSVQAYVLIAVVAFFGAAMLLKRVARDIGLQLQKIAEWLIIPVALFMIAWTIVGAIMFWGELNGSGSCHFWLSLYMWILLIVGCLSIILVIINILNLRK